MTARIGEQFDDTGNVSDINMIFVFDWSYAEYKGKKSVWNQLFLPFNDNLVLKTNQTVVLFNFFDATISIGKCELIEKKSIIDNYDYSHINTESKSLIFDISPLELVNFHQWQGITPIDDKDKDGRQLYKEPALWEIVTADKAKGQRIPFLRSHMDRDIIFLIQNRLQMMIDYFNGLLDGWEEIAAIHYKSSFKEPNQIPDLDDREKSQEMMTYIRNHMNETLPAWEWLEK